jgi:hypothetical protein
MSAVLGLVILHAGSMYFEWYNKYHGNLNAVMDCEIELMDEHRKVGIPMLMTSRELFDHCATEVFAAAKQ